MLLTAIALALSPEPGLAMCHMRGVKRTHAGYGQSWVGDDDYPPSALRAGQQGWVGFTLNVDAGGCPTACRVTYSSGHQILDDTTCSLMMARARFKPAEDDAGKPIAAVWHSRFQWYLN